MVDKVTVPSPYEPRLREIAAALMNAQGWNEGGEMWHWSEPKLLAVLRSELEIDSLMETIGLIVEAPNIPHPAALRKLREWREKWKR